MVDEADAIVFSPRGFPKAKKNASEKPRLRQSPLCVCVCRSVHWVNKYETRMLFSTNPIVRVGMQKKKQESCQVQRRKPFRVCVYVQRSVAPVPFPRQLKTHDLHI
jgi:hypothetical protein